jgi:hypothetical protein
MKNLTRYVTSVLTFALAGWLGTALITPAQATPLAQAGVCPDTTPAPAYGSAPDCNLLITFGPNGAISTSGQGGNYDGFEDALIGVVNNSGHGLSSFNISGNNIFGFDADGIDGYVPGGSPEVSGNPDNSGYGGPLGYFTNISGNSGTVNFWGGLSNGGTTYFSLEETIYLNALPVVTNNVPEPPVLAMFGLGLLGLGLLARRRKSA